MTPTEPLPERYSRLAFLLTCAFPSHFRVWIGREHQQYLQALVEHDLPNSWGSTWVTFAQHGQPDPPDMHAGRLETITSSLLRAAAAQGWTVVTETWPDGTARAQLHGTESPVAPRTGPYLSVVLAELLLTAAGNELEEQSW